MKFNDKFFKNWSTWQNIIEAVCVVVIQFLVTMPVEMTNALWGALALRVVMAFLQGVKQSVKSN